jgi:hypothetical protein
MCAKGLQTDIFNADETGIFFRLTPDRTLKFEGEKCVGSKLSKDRITDLVCANADGTEKRKLLVIGKSKNPRCFKNVKSLPVCYSANKKAWITSDIFEAQLIHRDRELRLQKRKILLLVDNVQQTLCLKSCRTSSWYFFLKTLQACCSPWIKGW